MTSSVRPAELTTTDLRTLREKRAVDPLSPSGTSRSTAVDGETMNELLTAAQMRACERAAIEAGEVTGLELMERAGRGVVDAMLAWRPQLAAAPHRAVVLCGPGNNGGDGFVVARLLKERGWDVEVFLYGDAGRLPPDARTNSDRWRQVGTIRDYWSFDAGMTCRDLTIDALFGTGIARPLEPAAQHEEVLSTSSPMVAVDLPTGLHADTGKMMEPGFAADLTVTFHRAKLGHFLAEGPVRCGHLMVADIGLGSAPLKGAVPVDIAPAPGILGKQSGHKYDHGHALILSGGVGKGGAARLAARGGLRIGAGLVTVGCPPPALQENAAALDAVMLAALPDAEALDASIRARKVDALCIGPGFGRGERLRAFVAAALRRPEPGQGRRGAHPARVVLDADAISEYGGDPGTLFAMLHENCVLTPHQGEFGRLFPDILERLMAPATAQPAYSKLDATREAAARAGCTVLFKGPDTVIADASGRAAVNSAAYGRAAPWLATAGTGDVLAGFIAGLLARGLPAFEAARTAAWLHVACALRFGPGVIAEDLPEQLPDVFRDLGL